MAPHPPSLQQDRPALLDLVREKAGVPAAAFFEAGEGSEMPDGTEEITGYAVLNSGLVYFFATGWDPERQRPTITRWKSVQPEMTWGREAEYQRARESVGLPPATVTPPVSPSANRRTRRAGQPVGA